MREPGSGSREVLGIPIVQSSETSKTPCDCSSTLNHILNSKYRLKKKNLVGEERKRKVKLFPAPNPTLTNEDAFLFPLLSLRSFADETENREGLQQPSLLGDLSFSLEARALSLS